MRIRSVASALGVAALGLSVAAVQAPAADYPVLRGSQIEDTPPPPDFFSGTAKWSGFYFGGTAGYISGQFDAYKQSDALAQQVFGTLAIRDSAMNLLRFGKASNDKFNFGGFIGYNFQFGDAVLGIEAEYLRANIQTDQRGSISRLYTDVFPTTIPAAPNVDAVNTQTAVTVDGHSATKIDDLAILKARAGYAFGNFMPFANIGLAVGRISTNGRMRQSHTTSENFGLFNTVTGTTGTVTRTTYAGAGRIARPDASGSSEAGVITSGYVPGFAIGGGLEALLGENLLLRAEFTRIYFASYKGVDAIVDSARVGAGLKF